MPNAPFVPLVILLAVAATPVPASQAPVVLDRDAVLGESGFLLPGPWEAVSRDAAAPHPSRMQWEVELDVAGDLAGLPLALVPHLTGAATVRVEGREIATWGSLALDATAYRGTVNGAPSPFVFTRSGLHRLVVDYENPDAASYARVGWPSRIAFVVASAGDAATHHAAKVRRASLQIGGFTSIFLAFGAFHLLLWVFDREQRGNLEFAFLCLFAAGLVFLLLVKTLIQRPEWIFVTEPLMNAMGAGFAFTGLRLIYRLTRPALPTRRLAVLAGIAAVLALWGLFQPGPSLPVLFVAMLAAFLEMIRAAVTGVDRASPGATAVAGGVVVLGAGFALGLLANLGVLPRAPALTTVVPFSSMVALILAASFSLSRRMAEGARQSREIEEARALQLSLLPGRLPQVSGIDLAAAMETATEVGGDYYDAALEGSGDVPAAVHLVVGDATGHGVRAGLLVTAMKGLFSARLGHGAAFLSAANAALRRMELRPMAMALTWVRVVPGGGTVACAGTPLPLFVPVHGEPRTLGTGAPPLGLLERARYEEFDFVATAGDVLVLMTDGLPESPARSTNSDGLLGGDGDELLGYERTRDLVVAAVRAGGESRDMVERILREAARFRGSGPPDDDITVVVARWT